MLESSTIKERFMKRFAYKGNEGALGVVHKLQFAKGGGRRFALV
jgi:hypothetical protein